ncbi:hypothetical protein Dimus_009039 [Dionaea muscipula]
MATISNNNRAVPLVVSGDFNVEDDANTAWSMDDEPAWNKPEYGKSGLGRLTAFSPHKEGQISLPQPTVGKIGF